MLYLLNLPNGPCCSSQCQDVILSSSVDEDASKTAAEFGSLMVWFAGVMIIFGGLFILFAGRTVTFTKVSPYPELVDTATYKLKAKTL